jgi:hypothetical protein
MIEIPSEARRKIANCANQKNIAGIIDLKLNHIG